jgi:hypothetical protein
MSPRICFLLPAALALLANASGVHAASAPREWVLYRPSTSTFYVRREPGNAPAREVAFGAPGDVPFWADFSGDGKRVPALYRKGQWLISTHADGKADLVLSFGGQPGDVPLVGDVDGDHRADVVAFRGGEWYVRGTRNPAVTQIYRFGVSGDVPLLADFDGDGNVDLAVFRSGHWYVDSNRDGNADLEFAFGGVAGERVLAGSGSDGRAVPILFRDGLWLVSAQRDGKVSEQNAFGAKGDIPVAVWTSK